MSCLFIGLQNTGKSRDSIKNIILILKDDYIKLFFETLKFQPHSCTVHVYLILNCLVILSLENGIKYSNC